jgi:signal transduction histidine kinase
LGALATTAIVLVAASALRLSGSSVDLALLGGRLFALLVAAALADVALLTRRRAPGVAWFAVVISLGIGVVELVGALRDEGLVTDATSTSLGLLVALAAFLAAAGIALVNAARSRPRHSSRADGFVVAAVAAAFLGVVVAAAWTIVVALDPSVAASIGDTDLSPIRLTGRLTLLAVGLGLAVGAFRDVAPAVARGWRRWRAGSKAGDRGSLAGNLADELIPWRAAAQSHVREDERARLAADLHALVLPDLRRAAAAVSVVGGSEPAVVGVQRALQDVEQLMHRRQSTVLEEFGLVAALEWLAERTEGHNVLRVDLELEGSSVDQRGAVPVDIARAAFRIAMLALDNVERHAGASAATIRLAVDPGLIALLITDDGRVRSTWTSAGGRGVADMRAESVATGGTLRLQSEPGTRIEVTWPRP